MKDHTTHHDDCGCLTARYEARIATLEADYQTARTAVEVESALVRQWMARARAEGFSAGRESARTIEVTQVWKKGESEVAQFVRVEDIAGMVERARAEGAASERAACELALALVERPKEFRADPIRHETFDDTVAACMYAIRARGERFPLSGADAPSEGGKA